MSSIGTNLAELESNSPVWVDNGCIGPAGQGAKRMIDGGYAWPEGAN